MFVVFNKYVKKIMWYHNSIINTLVPSLQNKLRVYSLPHFQGFIVQPTVGFRYLPSKVEKKFLKTFCKEDSILVSRPSGQFVHSVTGQRVHWWIDVTERKLVGGNLSIRCHVCLAKEQ